MNGYNLSWFAQGIVMRDDTSWYKYYRDCRDSLALDMFRVRFPEVQARCEENIATGEVYPRVFAVLQESPIAQMYNSKACERNS